MPGGRGRRSPNPIARPRRYPSSSTNAPVPPVWNAAALKKRTVSTPSLAATTKENPNSPPSSEDLLSPAFQGDPRGAHRRAHGEARGDGSREPSPGPFDQLVLSKPPQGDDQHAQDESGLEPFPEADRESCGHGSPFAPNGVISKHIRILCSAGGVTTLPRKFRGL